MLRTCRVASGGDFGKKLLEPGGGDRLPRDTASAMPMMASMFAVAFAVATAFGVPPGKSGAPPGDYESYVVALEWQPGKREHRQHKCNRKLGAKCRFTSGRSE